MVRPPVPRAPRHRPDEHLPARDPGAPLTPRACRAALGALLAAGALSASCGSTPDAAPQQPGAAPSSPTIAVPPGGGQVPTAAPTNALSQQPGPAAPPVTGGPAPAGCSWSRTDAEAASRARGVASSLTQTQRVAQLFVVGVPVTALAAGDGLARQGVGGIFLQGRSSLSTSSLAATTRRWAAEAPLRPWVAVDQEGGKVQTLTGAGFGAVPSALAQARLPPALRGGVAAAMASSLSQAGVTLDLAPVVDAVPAGTEARNAPIGAFQRQYGSTPSEAAAGAGTVACALAQHGVAATLKHFPGLGRVGVNTDLGPALDLQTGPDDPQVAVFGQLAATPARPFVMVSLASYPRLSPQIAAFAPEVVRGLLRGRLGFDGVVISDDLGAARAVAAVSPGERAVRFVAAGGTLVLTVRAADLAVMEQAVLSRCATDRAFAAQVDAAALVALTAKAGAGLL